jgi:hypothetical protein
MPLTVIPAQAGIQQQERQVFATIAHRRHWMTRPSSVEKRLRPAPE